MANDTKERILEAALEMFSQNGYTGTNIPQKSHRRHTGHLAVRLRRRSMRNWQQRNPLMSKWNTDYKKVGEMGCILSKQKQNR